MPIHRSLARISPQRAWLVAGVLLAAISYRDFLLFEPNRAIPDPLERMLFEPADTTPALVVALSLWLLWRRRERWHALPARTGPLGLTLALLAAGAAILVWARLTGAHDLLALSLIAAGLGLASLWKGAAGVRVLVLPAGFLLFAVPLPPAFSNGLIFRFQLWTAELVGQMLYLFAMPSRVVGETILRSDFTFSVVEGCSGLRSVVTLSMLAVLMVDLFRRQGLHAALLILAAPLVAFGLNAVRAIALIANPHSALAAVHIAQGVAILLCGLIVLYALDGVLARVIARAARPASPAAPGPAGGGPKLATLAVLVLLAVLSAAPAPWVRRDPVPLGLSYRFSGPIDGWTASPLESDRLFLGSVTFRESLAARFQRSGEAVDLFLGIGDRGQRFTSALSAKNQRPGSGWSVEEQERGNLDSREVDALVERSAGRRLLVYHWVDGSGGVLPESLRSLLALDVTPWSARRDPLVVRVATAIDGPGPEARGQAEARLRRFLASVGGDVEKLIRDMDHFATHSRRKGFS